MTDLFSHREAPHVAPRRDGVTGLAFVAPPTPTGVADAAVLDVLDAIADLTEVSRG